MVRRINVPSSSRLLVSVLSLALAAVFAQAQSSSSARQRSSAASAFIVAPAFHLQAAPTSVAAGDLNGDGKLDLVLTAKGSGSVTVLLGDGRGGFAPGVQYAAGIRPENALLADLGGGGKLDLAVIDKATGAVEVLRGNGDGTFAAPEIYSAVAGPIALGVGNFSGKGKIDLAVASASAVAILRNDGPGRFTPGATIPLTHPLQALAAADLSGEGHDDLIAAGADGTVTVLKGNGEGRFEALNAVKIGSGPLAAIAAADFNRDGRADLAVTHAGSNKLTVLLGHGDGSFEAGVHYKVGNDPAFVTAVDLKNSGVLDLVTANAAANTFSVLAGGGDGSFKPAAEFTAGNSPIALAAGDFYGNGHIDLAVLNAGDATVSLPSGQGDGTFHAARSYRAGLEHKAIAAGDLNGDGLADLVVTNYCGDDAGCKSNGTASVLLAEKDGSYKQAATYHVGSGPVAVALARVNSDKQLDLIALNQNEKTLTVLPGKGNGEFAAPQVYELSASPRAVYVGDFNGDGRPDLAVTTDCGRNSCTERGTVEILLGRANGRLVSAGSYSTGFSPVSIAGGDLRGTGHTDLLIANSCGNDSSCKSHGTATVLSGDGKGRFVEGGEFDLGSAPSSIALGSISGKGLDLVVAERGANRVSVMHSEGHGEFGPAVSYAAGIEPASLAIADFTGDGRPDVAVANFKDSTVSVLAGTATGALKAAVTYPVGAGPEALAVVSGAKGTPSGLVTANGNTGGKLMGSDVTMLRDAAAATDTVLQTPAPNASKVDAVVTLTAVVSPHTGGGSVSDGNIEFQVVIGGTPTALSDCGGAAGMAVDGTGTATCTTQQLPAAISPATTITLQAKYLGDGGTFAVSTSPTVTQTVSAASTTTVVTSSTGGTSTVNQAVTFTATISVTPTPADVTDEVPIAGTVTFTNGTNAIAGCAAAKTVVFNAVTGVGAATCTPTLSGFDAGTPTINAVFTPSDDNYATSNGSVDQTVNKENTAITQAASATPTVDEPLVITATVTATGAAVPMTGNVTFTGNIPGCGSPAAQVVAVAFAAGKGTATCTATAATLTAGAYNVSAAFGSDGNYNNSTTAAATNVTVAAEDTTTVVTSNANPSKVDQAVTLTATIAPPIGVTGSVSITGTVTFSGAAPGCGSPASVIVPVTFSGGVGTATCTPTGSSLTVGNYKTRASYSGDSNYNSSTSAQQTQTVNQQDSTTTLSSSATPDSAGQPLTVTATVAPPTGITAIVPLAGNVTFTGATGCSAPVAVSFAAGVGTATCTPTVSSLTAGTLHINASYASDTNYAGSSATQLNQQISKLATTVTLASSANPSAVDQPITITATVAPPTGVTPGINIGGTVTFSQTSGSIPGCTAPVTVSFSGGVATATCSPTPSSLTQGNYSISATYNGDTNYSTSNTAAPLVQVVGLAATTTVVTPPASSSTVDQPLTFTATVSPTSGSGSVAITGTALFSADGATIAGCNARTVTFNSGSGTGTATCTTAVLAAGSHTITAIYSGNTNYGGSPISAGATATVSQANTTTALGALPTPSTVDQSVTITAVISPNVSPAPNPASNIVPFLPSGTVAFTAGGTAIAGCGAVTVTPTATGASAACTTSALTAGMDSLAATYGGDASYKTSTASAITQKVNPATTITTLMSSTNPSALNQAVTFTATVTPASGAGVVAISATVAFLNGSTAIAGCTAQAVTFNSVTGNATAACTTASLTAGTNSITATYSGDSNYNTSTSSALPQAVGKNFATTALASSVPTSTVNQAVTFKETVSAPGGGGITPTGTVSFTDNGSPIANCTGITITSGAASCPTSTLSGGTHSIVANYSGDSNYAASTSFFSQVVVPVSSTISLASSSTGTPATSSINQAVIFTATVGPSTSPVPLTGTVTFTYNNGKPLAGCVVRVTSGTATCSTSSLPLGSDAVVATYGSDVSYNSSSSTLTQVVGQAKTTTALASAPDPSSVNESVTFTATVTYPPGATGLSGVLEFEDLPAGAPHAAPITGCTAVSPAAASAATSVASCTTSTLTVGPHTVSATYLNDANFATSTGSTQQTVGAAKTTTAVIPSSVNNSSVVDQNVTFTATVSSTQAGTAPFKGAMSFTNNGAALAGCTSIPVKPATGVAQCTTNKLMQGQDQIVATYAGDPSFATSSGSTTEAVGAAATTLVVKGPTQPPVASNPKNLNDTATFTATVTPGSFTPATAPVQLSGAVTFKNLDVKNVETTISGCESVKVSPSTGDAVCTTTALPGPSDTVIATYGSDSNYGASQSSFALNVEDYSLSVFAQSTVVVTQGFTTATDPIAPQTITITPTSFSGYTGVLTLHCSVNIVAAALNATTPVCAFGSNALSTATLSVTSSASQQSVSIVVDAKHASPGSFSVTVTGTDEKNLLSHSANSFPVSVLNGSTTLNIVSGATTGNSATVNFVLPAGKGLQSISCVSVSGPNLTAPVKPASLDIGCLINPASIPAASTIQVAPVTVTVTTGGTTAAAVANHSTVLVAGLFGIPLFALLGVVRGRRSFRTTILRTLAILAIGIAGLQAMGCGGSFKATTSQTGGKTPPGSYYLLIQGSDSQGNTYEAVLPVNVTL